MMSRCRNPDNYGAFGRVISGTPRKPRPCCLAGGIWILGKHSIMGLSSVTVQLNWPDLYE